MSTSGEPQSISWPGVEVIKGETVCSDDGADCEDVTADFEFILINVERNTQYYSANVTLISQELIDAGVFTSVKVTDRNDAAKPVQNGELISGDLMCVPIFLVARAVHGAGALPRFRQGDDLIQPHPCREQVCDNEPRR